MNNIIQNWINGNVYCAVEHTGQMNRDALFLLVVEKKKDTLKLNKSGAVYMIPDLVQSIPKNTGISLVINNDKVLTKTIDNSANDKEAVLQAFPTLKLSEFYYEVGRNAKMGTVSVCRKKDVDQILDEYSKEGLPVISFSLGNSVIFELENYIKNDTVLTTNTKVFFSALGIQEITSVNAIDRIAYSINDIEIANTHLLSFANILQSVSGSAESYSNFEELISKKKNEFYQKSLFQKGLYIGLGSLFILLIVNMLLFSHYQSQLTDWEQKNSINQQSKFKLQKIEKDVADQNKLIDEMFKSSGNHTTYILDDLTANLSRSISLMSIQYQPLTKTVKPDKEIIIATNELLVKGENSSNEDFTKWIALLEQKKWVKSVVILAYGGKSQIPEFTVKIEINDEW